MKNPAFKEDIVMDPAQMKVKANTLLQSMKSIRQRNLFQKELLKAWDQQHGEWMLKQIQQVLRNEEAIAAKAEAERLEKERAKRKARMGKDHYVKGPEL